MDDHVGVCTRNQDVTLFSISLNNCGLFKHDYGNRRLTPGFKTGPYKLGKDHQAFLL